MEKNRIGIDDRCSRSVAAMLSAREMPFQEAITHLSNLRFGVSLGLNNIVQTWEVDQLMVDVQTSHLNRLAESDKLAYPSIEEDELRALYLRRKLTE